MPKSRLLSNAPKFESTLPVVAAAVAAAAWQNYARINPTSDPSR
jgi:hypothetical protein